MKKGRFFVIEAIDGAGKTTAIKMVKSKLEQRFRSCVITHEPQEDRPAGIVFYEAIRNPDSRLSMLQKQEFCVRDRLVHIENFIRPQLDKGQIVLCDRYMMSTFAHGIFGASEAELWKLHQEIIDDKLIIPDSTFVLDVTVEEAQRRLATKGKLLDQLEKSREGQERTR